LELDVVVIRSLEVSLIRDINTELNSKFSKELNSKFSKELLVEWFKLVGFKVLISGISFLFGQILVSRKFVGDYHVMYRLHP